MRTRQDYRDAIGWLYVDTMRDQLDDMLDRYDLPEDNG